MAAGRQRTYCKLPRTKAAFNRDSRDIERLKSHQHLYRVREPSLIGRESPPLMILGHVRGECKVHVWFKTGERDGERDDGGREYDP